MKKCFKDISNLFQNNNMRIWDVLPQNILAITL